MRKRASLLALWTLGLGISGPVEPGLAQIPLRAYYNDDFFLESEDGSFHLRIRGNLHLDTRLYHGENRGSVQNIDIRRVRIDLQGRIHQRFTFRIQPELSGNPHIRNAWVDWEFDPALHLRWGQLKVPFSSSWLTLDNNVNFVERGASTPIYPYFDRGVVAWGELFEGTVTYDLGVFTGVGTDQDVTSGDIDDHKDLAARLFLQPFRNSSNPDLKGLVLVAEGTWGRMSVATPRFETEGYRSANFGAAIWRWRTDQVLGTNGRATDRVAAEIDSRRRLGAEVHYLRGPLALSTELLNVRYTDVALFHDFYVGSARTTHLPLLNVGGGVSSWSTWASYYLTGESKRLEDVGWRTARPEEFFGEGGGGAWEILGRYTLTRSDEALFEAVGVEGFSKGSPDLPPTYSGSVPGEGNTVTAAVFDGAHEVHELSAGVNWTLNPMVRLQLNDVFLWAPSGDRDGDGIDDNRFISGAFTAQSDPALRYRKTKWENAVLFRIIFKL
jgi:phosphate-selective porin OprO/OprP